jgi:two-component system phosphate regulon sensor histidine kinase PhoR
MSVQFKKSYRFAIRSAVYITVLSSLIVAGLTYFFFEFSWQFTLIYAACILVFAFLSIQYRLEHYIYSKVRIIYDDVTNHDSEITGQHITADIATLTREVQRFANDKRVQIEMLQDREQFRREFIGNVSHELKTPLFTVQGYLSTLIDGAVKDKTLRKKYLERAEKGVERLILIVQDLDMITKLESGDEPMRMERFDIIRVVQNAFDLLEMKASKKDIMLLFDRKYTKQIWVMGDQEKIEQALVNLLVNSIKYGKEKGSTEVSIEDFGTDKVIVRVTDNGEGIEKYNLPRIFERFYRVDKSGSRTEGGSGLGLSIVKHIVEAHQEKISVKSDVGIGSEFSFTLRKAKPDQA